MSLRTAVPLAGALGICAAIVVGVLHVTQSTAQSVKGGAQESMHAEPNASPIYGITIPPGYRDWRLIAVNHLAGGGLKQLRAQLGNDLAIKAFREGTLPFPDGAIIVALHYKHVPSEENNKVFGDEQSFVPGSPTNIQLEVKNSKKYAATGGWGFGFLKDGKPVAETQMKTCAPCHAKSSTDFVFTRYAP